MADTVSFEELEKEWEQIVEQTNHPNIERYKMLVSTETLIIAAIAALNDKNLGNIEANVARLNGLVRVYCAISTAIT